MILAGPATEEKPGFKMDLEIDKDDLKDDAKANAEIEITPADIEEAFDAVVEDMKSIGEDFSDALAKASEDIESFMSKVADKLGITKIAKFLDDAFKPNIDNREAVIEKHQAKLVEQCKGELCKRVNANEAGMEKLKEKVEEKREIDKEKASLESKKGELDCKKNDCLETKNLKQDSFDLLVGLGPKGSKKGVREMLAERFDRIKGRVNGASPNKEIPAKTGKKSLEKMEENIDPSQTRSNQP